MADERGQQRDEKVQHDSLESALDTLGVGLDASECHGSLVGMLLASPWNAQGFPEGLTDKRWVDRVLEDAAAGLEPDVRAEWALETLRRIWATTVEGLSSDAYGFEPMLPADDRSLGVRARAVGDWCAGFLSGLGQGGGLGETLSAQVREIISDFTEITRIEPSPEEGESSEQALTEIIEFVRAGVLLVDAELGFVVRGSPDDEASLH